MHALNMLEYGHQMVLDTVTKVEPGLAGMPGACGEWSIKDIVAHLASFEALILDAIASLTPGGATPVLDRFLAGADAYNNAEVAWRRQYTLDQIMAEYNALHATVIDRLIRIAPEKLRENGVFAWYGADYDLDDFLVYTAYAHKREHCAQIAAFADYHAAKNTPLVSPRKLNQGEASLVWC